MLVDDICSAEISHIPSLVEGQKMVQEAWDGRGKRELNNNVSNSPSVLHAQQGSEPKDHDGISVRALSTLVTWRGVRVKH